MMEEEDFDDSYDDLYHTLAAKAPSQSPPRNSSLHHPAVVQRLSDLADDVSVPGTVPGKDILAAGNGVAGEDFDLYGELFHVFISYRVATEGSKAPGNRFAMRLYDEVLALSRDVAAGLSIPPEGCGIYPSFAREPPEHSKKNQQAKV